MYSFKPTHRVIAEHDDHLYELGTPVKLFWSYGPVEYAWYVDEEGIAQIMNSNELEVV